MKECLIPFPRLETCFRDGLCVPLWLHAYLAFINKITTKPTFSLIVIPKGRTSLIYFIRQCRNLCQMPLFPPSFPFCSKYLTPGCRDKLFSLNTWQNVRKYKTLNTDHTCPREQLNQTKKSSSEIQTCLWLLKVKVANLSSNTVPFPTEKRGSKGAMK